MRAFCKRHKVLTFFVSVFILGFIYLYVDLYPKYDPNAPKEIDGDLVPPRRHPFVYYFDQSLLGIDEDNDGVMDEFEHWVNDNIEESTERILLKLRAKAITNERNAKSIEEFRKIRREIETLGFCIIQIETEQKGLNEFHRTVIEGNWARKSFEQKIGSMMSGSIGFSPSNVEDISTICPYTNEVLKYFEDKKRKHMDRVNEISQKAMDERAKKEQYNP